MTDTKQGPARPGLLQIFRLAEAAHGIGDNGPQDSRVVSFARAVLAAKNGLTVKDQV